MPIVRWYRILITEKKLRGDLAAFWLEIVFNTLFTSEKCVVNCPISGNKIKKAASDSINDVCILFELQYYDSDDHIKAEPLAVKVVEYVYGFLKENGFETGRKVDGEKLDEALRLIDFSKTPELVL